MGLQHDFSIKKPINILLQSGGSRDSVRLAQKQNVPKATITILLQLLFPLSSLTIRLEYFPIFQEFFGIIVNLKQPLIAMTKKNELPSAEFLKSRVTVTAPLVSYS